MADLRHVGKQHELVIVPTALRILTCASPFMSRMHTAWDYRWADGPAAIQAMAAFTDNFTRLCLAAPHISARAPALREVISLFRILGKRDVEAHPG